MRRIAITSTLGNPHDRKTWSAAPFNLSNALRDIGVETVPIDSGVLSKPEKILLAAKAPISGIPPTAFSWGKDARKRRGDFVAQSAAKAGVDHILCCGTMDCPLDGAIPYSIWLDNSWDLWRGSGGAPRWSKKVIDRIEALERNVLNGAAKVLTFSEFLRDNIISHYGVPSDRVVAVGCGSGPVAPLTHDKIYADGHLLFVAKIDFEIKGGDNVLEAFDIIRKTRPQTKLVIVGNDSVIEKVGQRDGVELYGWVEQEELNRLFHDAAMLVQPMLHDPWGQVYLEAMKSRAIVVALNRAALPELTDNGRLGRLVETPDPMVLAEAVLETYARPQAELAAIGAETQKRVLERYDWSTVARHVVDAIAQ